MPFQQRGAELIGLLKDHVLEVLRSHPDCEPGGMGVALAEVARRAGLHSMGTVELDETCGEFLSLLRKEGKVEKVGNEDKAAKHSRWRLVPR